MSKHQYAHILHALAEGETIQCLNTDKGNTWEDLTSDQVFSWIMRRRPVQYLRPKPKVVRIGGCEVDEPYRTAPEVGTAYYRLNLRYAYQKVTTWHGDEEDLECLQKGLAFKTKDDMEKAKEAILDLLTTKPSTN